MYTNYTNYSTHQHHSLIHLLTYIMQPFKKSLSSKPLKSLLTQFPSILIQTKIDDKPHKVTNAHYCRSNPKVRANPHISGLSTRMLQQLGYDQNQVINDPQSALYLSGSKLIPGSVPVCNNYCGYQFGAWAGQLGDGRAHTIGHIIHENSKYIDKHHQNNKEKGNIYQLQMKGSGLTPFSRHADGNSVVSSAVRQFLASQLMHGLKVPTTRALSLVIADQDVIRDPFYNGVIKIQKAAIVVRVAESFLRFGSFQVCNKGAQLHKGSQIQNRKILTALADYLIQNFYPQIDTNQGEDIYEQLFKIIIIRTAELVAHWQSIGFVHGVLNTDNMSMVNVTIDYGPFGFIDYFSKDYVSNATDQHQRYSYRRQPSVVKWNLQRLAESFDILVPYNVLKKHIDQLFDSTYQKMYDIKMSEKLGLNVNTESKAVIAQLLQVMHNCGSNFTNTFRILSQQIPKQQMVTKLMAQALPTDYLKRSLRIISNPNISQQQIKAILAQDNGFNQYFLTEQPQRRKMLQFLINQPCQVRTAVQKQMWENWLTKYQALKPNKQQQRKHTIHYVLLNQVAKNITEQLITLSPVQQRSLMNKILDVFANPYEYNQWFQKKYWSKRPVPVRLTCSS